uniref:CCHC-type domain-containing protein n=1 Tax=Trichuris muris TaxID=70415 RepID=A0A5S6Q933_TRIMR
MAKAFSGALEAFDVSLGIDGWEDWIERFGFFAEVNNVPQARQRSLLFTYCGPALYRLVKEAVAPEKPDTKSLDELVEAVRGRFDPIPGVYSARAEFYNRKELPEESAATFMSNLRRLAQRCQFEAAPSIAERIDSQLQDQFLIGMSDVEKRRRVLRGSKITLKELYNAALAGGSAVEESKLIDSHSVSLTQPTIHALRSKSRTRTGRQMLPTLGDRECWRCGASDHAPGVCRFKGSQCYRCRKLGHMSKVCRSSLIEPTTYNPSSHQTGKRGHRKIHAVAQESPRSYLQTSESEDDSPMDQNRIGALKINATSLDQAVVEPATTISILVNGTQVEFEIDTGSALTLISEKTFRRLWNGSLPVLRKSKLNIRTWSRESMTVLGSFRANVQYRNISRKLDVFVLRNGGQPLLGRAWFRPLIITLNIPTHQAYAMSESTECRGNGWKKVVDKYSRPSVYADFLYADLSQRGLTEKAMTSFMSCD